MPGVTEVYSKRQESILKKLVTRASAYTIPVIVSEEKEKTI